MFGSNFCVNCGSKLKINNYHGVFSSKDSNQFFSEQNEIKTIDYQYAESSDDSTYSSENLEKIFSENKFTIGQINKIKSFIKKNNDENSIEKLIQDEISNNKHQNELLDEEYEILLEFSKNNDG